MKAPGSNAKRQDGENAPRFFRLHGFQGDDAI